MFMFKKWFILADLFLHIDFAEQSHWSSTNDDIISIDQSGIAVAHGIGSAHVVYIHKRFTAKTDVSMTVFLYLNR